MKFNQRKQKVNKRVKRRLTLRYLRFRSQRQKEQDEQQQLSTEL
ncbi:hypothetical protein [Motilimonas pumila]|nr:hypothetical protein [Motilimonas pumila]